MKKRKIRIAHLYYDMMNLYGESGNVRALEEFIHRQGVETEVVKLGLSDPKDFQKYDFYYMGQGDEENQLLALADLSKYKDEIKTSIESGKTFLVTGNAFSLFGKKLIIKDPAVDDVCYLNIFDYNAILTERSVSELFYEFPELEEGKGRNLVGFKNCSFNIVNNDGDRMFGFQDNLRYKRFYGMSFVGPILIRNPYFTDYILKNLFDDLKMEYKPSDDEIEYTAYHRYIKNFITNRNLD